MKKIEAVFEYCKKNNIKLNAHNTIEHYVDFANDIIENYTLIKNEVSVEELVEVLLGVEEGLNG